MSEPMMSVTIDPSETRRAPPPAPRRNRATLRIVLLSGLGACSLAGFAALASVTLGGLAGPQFARPTLAMITVPAGGAQTASAWPDLRDGVPALAPAKPIAEVAVPAVAPAEKVTPVRSVEPVAGVAVLPAAIAPAAVPVDARPPETRPDPVAAKPARIPPIEIAAVVPPARPASLIPAARTAVVLAPLPAETTRSRVTAVAAPAPEQPRRKAVVAVAPPAKPVTRVATAAPEPEAPRSEAEPEQTEFFGVKVPSLAPAGRRLAEGVEAIGNAVRNLPDHF